MKGVTDGTDYPHGRRRHALNFHARLFQSHLFVIFARTQNNL